MESLNNILEVASYNYYRPPFSKQEALGRAGALLGSTILSYIISDEETGFTALDDYLFPTIRGTLVGLTAASMVLAGDFFLNHHHEHAA